MASAFMATVALSERLCLNVLWERRLELLQKMGCNAIRLSHNPPASELLDLLDRMGFLVMHEAFDEWRLPKGQTPVYGYHRYFDE